MQYSVVFPVIRDNKKCMYLKIMIQNIEKGVLFCASRQQMVQLEENGKNFKI